MKKKCVYFFFMIFPAAGNNEKKIHNEKKKKFVVQNRFRLLPKLYCEKKNLYCKAGLYCSLGEKKLYCDNRFCIAKIEIVLQRRRELRAVFVAIQYFCIVEKKTLVA